METVIAEDPGTRRDLAAWMRARGKERRERIWFRDADAAEAVDAILFVGLLLPGWYPPGHDCGACGYATCAEFLHHTKPCAASPRPRIHRPGLQPARHRPRHRGRLSSQNRRHPLDRLPVPGPRRDRRPQTRPHPGRPRRRPVTVHDPQGGRLRPAHARPDFDNLDLPPTGTQPAGVPGAARHGGARNRQATPAADPPHPASGRT